MFSTVFKGQRRTKLKAALMPVPWRRIIGEYCLFYSRLSRADQRELDGHIQVFLAEKQFEGCGGFAVEDEYRVCIAAQACLLLLHRETDYYPGLRSILVYPTMYVVPTTRYAGSGVMADVREYRAGESWPARKQRYADWARVMRAEYEQLRARIQHGEPTLLREYGATNPVEFFAVATECFFGKPHELQQRHPELYEQMRWYYKQDPRGGVAITGNLAKRLLFNWLRRKTCK
ncbi:MAG TPA: M90 family metallopeptidase [Candidatus Acidoferrum sp.]|nr:M90 family metallopeptidase [Candidatus Acidoferrum sp.]